MNMKFNIISNNKKTVLISSIILVLSLTFIVSVSYASSDTQELTLYEGSNLIRAYHTPDGDALSKDYLEDQGCDIGSFSSNSEAKPFLYMGEPDGGEWVKWEDSTSTKDDFKAYWIYMNSECTVDVEKPTLVGRSTELSSGVNLIVAGTNQIGKSNFNDIGCKIVSLNGEDPFVISEHSEDPDLSFGDTVSDQPFYVILNKTIGCNKEMSYGEKGEMKEKCKDDSGEISIQTSGVEAELTGSEMNIPRWEDNDNETVYTTYMNITLTKCYDYMNSKDVKLDVLLDPQPDRKPGGEGKLSVNGSYPPGEWEGTVDDQKEVTVEHKIERYQSDEPIYSGEYFVTYRLSVGGSSVESDLKGLKWDNRYWVSVDR